jgi:hypothetical protein
MSPDRASTVAARRRFDEAAAPQYGNPPDANATLDWPSAIS